MEILRSHQAGTVTGRIASSAAGWTMPTRGVRIRGNIPLTHETLTRGLIAAADRVAVACDLTAAHLWSMVVPSGFGLDVDAQACAVATFPDRSRLQAQGARGRRLMLPPDHVTELNGIALTTPARTWVDCAALVRWHDTVAMGDALLRAGLADRADLQRLVTWAAGRRGVRSARWALPLLDPRAESPAESWVRSTLLYAGVRAPVCNPCVEAGGYEFRLDMAWLDEHVAVEYDGEEFHGPAQRARDQWRRELLRRAGWIVVVLRKEDLSTPEIWVSTVRDLLESRER